MKEFYKEKHIKFIFKRKSKGDSYNKIVSSFNSKFKDKRANYYRVKQALSNHQTKYGESFPDLTPQEQLDIEKKEIISIFQKMVKKNGFVPNATTFSTDSGVDRREVKKLFQDYDGLERSARVDDPSIFGDIIDETNFTTEKFKELKKATSSYERFFITTAVTGCTPHEKGLASIKTFCELMNAKMLTILVSDPANNKPKKYKFSAHASLPADSIIFRDLQMNSNLSISTIKLQAKQINPLTGLRGLGQKHSCILGSPKQLLEPVSTSNKGGVPKHLITTGAITKAQYETKHYISERTAYLATDSHTLGGVIVEIQDNKTFFYRHVQIDPKTGTFCDLNKKFFPDGHMEYVKAKLIQIPDWHVGSTCPTFRGVAKEIVALMKPQYVTLEDFFDGNSINPFERKNIIDKSRRLSKKVSGFGTLAEEFRACSAELSEICSWDCESIVVKRGNHGDFLHRWLSGAEYAADGTNHYMGVILAKAMLEGKAPIEYALREIYPFDNQKKVRFLKITDSFKVDGIESGAHGHLGAGGKRNPGMKGLECFGKCNTGHTHAPAILGGVWRVGTATTLQLSYNVGASAWSNTLLIQHYGGSRQLVTMIDGKWRLED